MQQSNKIKGVPLNFEGIRNSAIQAKMDGLSFDEFCELIAKVIISGQSFDQIKQMLINVAIDTIFDEDQDDNFFLDILP